MDSILFKHSSFVDTVLNLLKKNILIDLLYDFKMETKSFDFFFFQK